MSIEMWADTVALTVLLGYVAIRWPAPRPRRKDTVGGEKESGR